MLKHASRVGNSSLALAGEQLGLNRFGQVVVPLPFRGCFVYMQPLSRPFGHHGFLPSHLYHSSVICYLRHRYPASYNPQSWQTPRPLRGGDPREPARPFLRQNLQAQQPRPRDLRRRLGFQNRYLPHDTTGLTPAIGNAFLKTPKRRVSTPAVTRYDDHDEVQFTPFRQQLSARTQRQIRRIGLSDEQNQFFVDKKAQAQLLRQLDHKNKELQALKDDLEASKLREATLLQSKSDVSSSQERINQLETEVAELTQQSSQETSRLDSASFDFGHDDGFQIYEDDFVSNENDLPPSEDDDITVDLELENARQAKEAMFRSSQSFSNKVVQFEDSPIKSDTRRQSIPSVPDVSSHDLSKELNSAVHRAEEAEVALQVMATEIKSLGFTITTDDAAQCLTSIKTHFRDMRLELGAYRPRRDNDIFQQPSTNARHAREAQTHRQTSARPRSRAEIHARPAAYPEGQLRPRSHCGG